MALRATVLLSAAVLAAGNLHDRSYYEAKFFDWIASHTVAPTSGAHFVHLLQNFANNDDIIETHNAKLESFTLGHNQFSHLSLDEWKVQMHFGLMPASNQTALVHSAPADLTALPASVDWNAAGAVTGVKDQGQCGSCWSFSATGAMEGAYEIKYKSLVSFSEQELVDCDNRQGTPRGSDMGCNGGLMDSAFSWVKANGGLCTEAGYPYTSGVTKTAGTCTQSSCTKNTAVAPKSYTDVQVNSDAAMMSALAQQPVSIAIEADQSAFQLYKSGVFSAACGSSLDHGVLATGYGTLNGADYYSVKNSWGTSWGMNGYILLARGGSMPAAGQCGMLSGPPSYPSV